MKKHTATASVELQGAEHLFITEPVYTNVSDDFLKLTAGKSLLPNLDVQTELQMWKALALLHPSRSGGKVAAHLLIPVFNQCSIAVEYIQLKA